MEGSRRIILNTVILYAKILICMGISLYTVPLVLHALGKSDYGLFNLIAGVISMLAFMNAAMTLSTQRYLSVTIGERNDKKLQEVYNISICLHVVIAGAVVLLIELAMPFLFQYVLNIEETRLGIALQLYHLLVVSMFFSIVAVPFDAVMNAYENMAAFSIISIIEAILKLLAALLLTCVPYDRLLYYGTAMVFVAFLVFVLKFVYIRHSYKHLHIRLQSARNMQLFREMFSFAGWNTLSALAVVGRNQGIAITLNHFLGTVINAAYGIANQVNSTLCYFSATIQKSVNPQLMLSEGAHEQSRLIILTYALTKYSLLALAVLALPLIIEMPYVLGIWIGDTPQYAVPFTRIIIVLSLITQSSAGLMSAVQSSGRVKYYTIAICRTLLSTVLVAYLVLRQGYSPVTALWLACVIEVGAFFIRLYFANRLNHIPVWDYLKRIILPHLFVFVFVCMCLYAISLQMDPSFFRLLTVCAIDVVLYAFCSFLFIFNREERHYIVNIVNSLKSKL